MRPNPLLEELEEISGKVGLQVSYEQLGADVLGGGGICKVKGHWRVILDRRAPPIERLTSLATALARFDLEGVYLSPAARELMTSYQARQGPPEGAPERKDHA